MVHSYNVGVAMKYGVQSASILYNMAFWIDKNRANEKNFFDGNYWTYNSKKAFAKLFPEFSEKQIGYALDKLIAEEIIITGNYNKSSYDRTLWYAITKKGYSILQNCQMDNPELSNGCPENVRPIPYINTDYKQTDINEDINTYCTELENSAQEEPIFITLTLNNKDEYPVHDKDVAEYKGLYPAADVEQALRSMRAWLNANPSKRKTKTGIKRFINSWLAREQDRGGAHGGINGGHDEGDQQGSKLKFEML